MKLQEFFEKVLDLKLSSDAELKVIVDDVPEDVSLSWSRDGKDKTIVTKVYLSVDRLCSDNESEE